MSIKLLQTSGSSAGYFQPYFLRLHRRACHELYWKMFDIFHVHNSGLQEEKGENFLSEAEFVVINISDVIYLSARRSFKNPKRTQEV
jgi:hypothetical protein